MIRRFLSSLLSASLVVLSPGLAPYAVAANNFSTKGAGSAVTGQSVVAPAASISIPALNVQTGFKTVSLGTPNGVSLNGAAASGVAAGANGAVLPSAKVGNNILAAGAAQKASAVPADRAVTASAAAAASKTGDMAARLGDTLNGIGNVEKASAGSAYSAGAQVQNIITGERSVAPGDASLPVAASADMTGSFRAAQGGVLYGKPAGQDSIDAAAKAYFGSSDVPPADNDGGNNGGGNNSNNDGGNGGGGSGKAPLIPRLLSAALALVPAALIGWPLLASGAVFAGALTIAGSVGVAFLPFLSDRVPSFVRTLPGYVIGGLGLTTLAAGFTGLGAGALAMGALVTLGGWGFVRFAKTGGRKYDSPEEIVGAFFGALGAVTGAGLVLLAPAGIVATVFTIAAYPVTLALFMYLPGWVGKALEAAFEGIGASFKDSFRTLTSLRRDTNLRKRVEELSRSQLKASPWNAVWLSLVVWLPIVVSETLSMAAGALGGLVLGVLRAPLMLLWGASHKISKESKATKFFASWARAQFTASKVALFNRFEKKLIPAANSSSKLKSWPAAAGIRVLQVLWLAYNLVRTPLVYVTGFFGAFKATGEAYEAEKHDPDYLSLGKDPLPNEVPEVPESEAKSSLPSKIIASLIAAAPIWFLGGSMLGFGFLGWGMLGAMIFTAAMPLMPSSKSVPQMLRNAPATLLAVVGGIAAARAAFFTLAVGLPTGWIIPLGAVALLSGIGLRSLIGKLRDEKTESWKLDEPEYIGGFVSALAITAALAASFVGFAGPLALVLNIGALALSPLLLYHLPAALWFGVGVSLLGMPAAVKGVYQVMESWHDDSRFTRNLKDWYGYWTKKSVWYGAMFLVPWALQLANYVVDVVVALPVGLAVGVTRIPSLFAWGWAYKKDRQSRATRFWEGFNKYLIEKAEFSKEKAFEPLFNKLKAALEDKDAESSRPTVKAGLALIGVRLLQLYWTLRTLLLAALTPLLWIPAFFAARKYADAPLKEGEQRFNERPKSFLL